MASCAQDPPSTTKRQEMFRRVITDLMGDEGEEMCKDLCRLEGFQLFTFGGSFVV